LASKDPRIDAKIAKSPDFAKPILNHIRKLMHQGCPDAEETLKWGMPHFMYQGKILGGMGSFKAHAAFGFWHGELVTGKAAEEGMGQFGNLTSVKDLPPDKAMLGYVKKAMQLIEQGVTSPTRSKDAKPRPPIKPPAWFLAALKKDKKAAAHFQAFTPGKQREYLEWLTEAKTDATREKRLATALEWMAEGKEYNWKYKKK
jgi:uncharacterized protein YdeI (YjbR/CyaY-like superfamily)